MGDYNCLQLEESMIEFKEELRELQQYNKSHFSNIKSQFVDMSGKLDEIIKLLPNWLRNNGIEPPHMIVVPLGQAVSYPVDDLLEIDKSLDSDLNSEEVSATKQSGIDSEVHRTENDGLIYEEMFEQKEVVDVVFQVFDEMPKVTLVDPKEESSDYTGYMPLIDYVPFILDSTVGLRYEEVRMVTCHSFDPGGAYLSPTAYHDTLCGTYARNDKSKLPEIYVEEQVEGLEQQSPLKLEGLEVADKLPCPPSIGIFEKYIEARDSGSNSDCYTDVVDQINLKEGTTLLLDMLFVRILVETRDDVISVPVFAGYFFMWNLSSNKLPLSTLSLNHLGSHENGERCVGECKDVVSFTDDALFLFDPGGSSLVYKNGDLLELIKDQGDCCYTIIVEDAYARFAEYYNDAFDEKFVPFSMFIPIIEVDRCLFDPGGYYMALIVCYKCVMAGELFLTVKNIYIPRKGWYALDDRMQASAGIDGSHKWDINVPRQAETTAVVERNCKNSTILADNDVAFYFDPSGFTLPQSLIHIPTIMNKGNHFQSFSMIVIHTPEVGIHSNNLIHLSEERKDDILFTEDAFFLFDPGGWRFWIWDDRYGFNWGELISDTRLQIEVGLATIGFPLIIALPELLLGGYSGLQVLDFDVVRLFWMLLCKGPHAKEMAGLFATLCFDILRLILNSLDFRQSAYPLTDFRGGHLKRKMAPGDLKCGHLRSFISFKTNDDCLIPFKQTINAFYMFSWKHHLGLGNEIVLVVAVKVDDFVWDPGENVNSFYILEDKDVVVRVGKWIIAMDHRTKLIVLLKLRSVRAADLLFRECFNQPKIPKNEGNHGNEIGEEFVDMFSTDSKEVVALVRMSFSTHLMKLAQFPSWSPGSAKLMGWSNVLSYIHNFVNIGLVLNEDLKHFQQHLSTDGYVGIDVTKFLNDVMYPSLSDWVLGNVLNMGNGGCEELCVEAMEETIKNSLKPFVEVCDKQRNVQFMLMIWEVWYNICTLFDCRCFLSMGELYHVPSTPNFNTHGNKNYLCLVGCSKDSVAVITPLYFDEACNVFRIGNYEMHWSLADCYKATFFWLEISCSGVVFTQVAQGASMSKNFIWDPDVYRFTTLRTRWFLRGRSCHELRSKIRNNTEDAPVTVKYQLLAVSCVIALYMSLFIILSIPTYCRAI